MCAHPLLHIAKAGGGRVPQTETYDTRGWREGVRGLHDRGGKGISRGRRTAGGDAQSAALTILGVEVAGMRTARLAGGPRGSALLFRWARRF